MPLLPFSMISLASTTSLSVSSSGSMPLLPVGVVEGFYLTGTFSILKRIDAPATWYTRLRRRCVSGTFQYPQTDRCPCYVAFPFESSRAVSLSVSSRGSMPLLQEHDAEFALRYQPFSILSRIDAPATGSTRKWATRSSLTFSILSRIDAPATPAHVAAAPGGRVLSVSSRGSMPLLPIARSHTGKLIEPFSILSRIDAPATALICSSRCRPCIFQYPLADRCPCYTTPAGA